MPEVTTAISNGSLAYTHTGRQGQINYMTLFNVHPFLPSTSLVAPHISSFASSGPPCSPQ